MGFLIRSDEHSTCYRSPHYQGKRERLGRRVVENAPKFEKFQNYYFKSEVPMNSTDGYYIYI